MPTPDELKRFLRDYDRLTRAQQDAFMEAVAQFVEDLLAQVVEPAAPLSAPEDPG